MGRSETSVHPTAVVDSKANLDIGVHVGPYSVIGRRVFVGKNTRIDGQVYIDGHVEIGKDCHLFPYSTIGTEPQDLSYNMEETQVVIGDRNILREFMTIHRGTVKGDGTTRIGDDNYFMAYSHVAHDCQVGNSTIFIHGATLGGHCIVGDFAQVGAYSGVHQFCKIGKYAFIGGYSVITQDVLPFCKVAGARPPYIFGPNAIGLRRLGFSRERIKGIKGMFRIIFHSDLNTNQAVEKIKAEFSPGEDRDEILSFIQSSQRGFLKKTAEEWKKDWE